MSYSLGRIQLCNTKQNLTLAADGASSRGILGCPNAYKWRAHHATCTEQQNILSSKVRVLAREFIIFHMAFPDLPQPTGLIANQGLELLTFLTPNGMLVTWTCTSAFDIDIRLGLKVSILLEELGLEYKVQTLVLASGVQKKSWYTDLNPNGKIPTLVDHGNGDFAVSQSQGKPGFYGIVSLLKPNYSHANAPAILTYLIRTYDKESKFYFTDPKDISRCEQWLAFHSSEMAPTHGNAFQFYRFLPDQGELHPFPMQKYVGECERLYGVLDKVLEGRNYLVGSERGKYSIADIANWVFVDHSGFAGVGIDLGRWPNLETWHGRIAQRPAVKRGVQVPLPPIGRNEVLRKKMADDVEEAKKEAVKANALKMAREQCGYTYKSP